MTRIQNWWSTFIYNYRWSDWVGFIDGWIPKFALFVPILGYLIIFNDSISEILIFEKLANETVNSPGLGGVLRLRLIYFALILLGVSNLIYRIKKPYQFRLGTNLVDYTRTGLEIFTLSDYVEMHGTIRNKGHLTLSGKYYDSEWEGFLDAAKNSGEGTDSVVRNGDWESAKSQYGGLLRGILNEIFFRYDSGKRIWLTICLSLSAIGYILLIIPSLDIFIKVINSTFGT